MADEPPFLQVLRMYVERSEVAAEVAIAEEAFDRATPEDAPRARRHLVRLQLLNLELTLALALAEAALSAAEAETAAADEVSAED